MKYVTCFLCMLCHSFSHAQMAGFSAMDSYLPLSGAELNPALATESRGNWAVSPCRTDVRIFNNFFSLNMPYSPYRLIGKNTPGAYTTVNGNPVWDWTWIRMRGDADIIRMNAFVRNTGPAFIIKKGKWFWTFRSDMTGFVSADGLPGNIIRKQIDNWNSPPSADPLQSIVTSGLNRNGTMTITQQAYVAMSLGVARRFKLLHNKDLAIGFNYRVLHSLGGYYLHVKTGNIVYDSDKGVEVKSPSVYFAQLYARRNVLWAHGPGSADLGVVYTYRNVETRRPGGYNQMHPDYKWKLGFSILDLGNLIYTRTIVTDVRMKSDVKLPDPEELMDKTPEEIIAQYTNSFQREIGITNTMTYGNKVKVGLPARMVFSADYQLSEHLFWGSVYVQNLRKKNSNNIMVSSYLSTGLRAEYRYLGWGVPITWTPSTEQLSAGLNLRFAQLFFGTSNLLTFMRPKGIYSADIYFGIQITNLPGSVFKKKLPYIFTRRRSCAQF